MNNETPKRETRTDLATVVMVAVCAIGFLCGGLIGLIVGSLFGNEFAGIACYVLGSIGGVLIAYRAHRKKTAIAGSSKTT